MRSVASAPGKIVLAGEYAVLWDAPAICMAVTRRAVASVTDSADGTCHLRTPGFEGADRFAVRRY
jgi:phosphomevalonate kinase